jgi:hypothetical protein
MPPGHVKRGYDFRGQLLKELTRRYKERFLLGTTLYEAERSLRASVPSGLVGVLLGLAKSIYPDAAPYIQESSCASLSARRVAFEHAEELSEGRRPMVKANPIHQSGFARGRSTTRAIRSSALR